MTGDRKPLVQIATLRERESKAGRKHFSGFLGDAQLLLFHGEEITRDNGEIVQTWKLMIQERDRSRSEKPTPEPRRDLPVKGQRVWDRARDEGLG